MGQEPTPFNPVLTRSVMPGGIYAKPALPRADFKFTKRRRER
jgi:hypothetical protein